MACLQGDILDSSDAHCTAHDGHGRESAASIRMPFGGYLRYLPQLLTCTSNSNKSFVNDLLTASVVTVWLCVSDAFLPELRFAVPSSTHRSPGFVTRPLNGGYRGYNIGRESRNTTKRHRKRTFIEEKKNDVNFSRGSNVSDAH